MPRMTKWVIVTFESYWSSGTLTLKPGKALNFARCLKRNHMAFLKKLDFFGDQWLKFDELPKGHEKLKVKFEVIYKPVVYARRKDSLRPRNTGVGLEGSIETKVIVRHAVPSLQEDTV